MRLGPLNKRGQFQRRLEVQADSGEMQYRYSDLPDGARWVSIEPLSGREFFAAQQLQNAVSTKIGLRYFPELTEKMRFVYIPNSAKPTFAEVYTIEGILHTKMDRRATILMCTKQIVQGFKRDGSDA